MLDGNWLIDELFYHKKKSYNKILIFNTKKTILPDGLGTNVYCYQLEYNLKELLFSIVKTFFKKEFHIELRNINKSKKNRIFKTFRSLMHFAIASCYARTITSIMKSFSISISDSNIFYAYWMAIQAEIFIDLKRKFLNSSFITRCHSIDIYEERDKIKYLENRQVIIDTVDRIYSISENGIQYLINRYQCHDRCSIARLGCSNKGMFIDIGRADKYAFKIVTCSSLYIVKRIYLVIEILKRITDIPVTWHHYGTGPLLDELKKKCESLPSNITYEFKGHVSHRVLFNEYLKEKYDLLLNVSSAEGVPVSMMEAISVGIPLLGTNVGGVREVIKEGITGNLMNVDSTINEMVDNVRYFINLNDSDYRTLRKKCTQYWHDNFDSTLNYAKFANDIYNLNTESE